ncbi:MAG: hypothetical protein JOZ66_09515, partial [Hyphomicrobiales bacterium]|nr:hypothetical protein [Hyphomicrobiales bacterium]
MLDALSRLAALVFCVWLAACNQETPVPSAQAAAPPSGFATQSFTPQGFALPGGAGCEGDVARFRAVMSNDYQTGNVNLSVYKSITSEIDQADHV